MVKSANGGVKVPLDPPPSTSDDKEIELLSPPVCGRCRSSPSPSPLESVSPVSSPGNVVAPCDSTGSRNKLQIATSAASVNSRTQSSKGPRGWSKKASCLLCHIKEAGDEEDTQAKDLIEKHSVKSKRGLDVRQDIAGKTMKEGQEVGSGEFQSSPRKLQSGADLIPAQVSRDAQMSRDLAGGPNSASARLADGSLFALWDDIPRHKTASFRSVPPWMPLLPAQRDGANPWRGTSAPVDQRSPSSITITASTLNAQPETTVATSPRSESLVELDSLTESPKRSAPYKTPTSHNLLRQSQRSANPTIDSTSSNTQPSSYLAVPHRSHSKAYPRKNTQPRRSRTTSEHHTQPSEPGPCPCCNLPLTALPSSANDVVRANGHTYHAACFRCRICGASVVTRDCIFLAYKPYHIACVQGKTPALRAKREKLARMEKGGDGTATDVGDTTGSDTAALLTRVPPTPRRCLRTPR